MEMLMNTLKWSMIAGAAALLLTCLRPLLDERYSPGWRYWTWLALAALMLLAPVRWEGFLPAAAHAPALVIGLPPTDEVLPVLWLSGAAMFLLYRLLGTLLLQWWAGRRGRAPGESTACAYSEVCRELGLRKVPPIRTGCPVASPMLTGFLRPRLLLPGRRMEERELRFILRHELTHCRRHDLWYRLVILLANAVHWFNPLAYLLSREAARDMELTCDALVAAGADAGNCRSYSEALLGSVHRKRGILERSAVSTHFYGGAAVMRERFRNILRKRERRRGGVLLILTLLAVLAAACMVGISC